MGVTRNYSNALDLVQGYRQQYDIYRRQWANWLGLGSAGGVLALLSFATNLPDPDHALNLLLPSLSAFVVGLISAAPNLLMASQEASAMEAHLANSFNRDSLQEAINKIPEVFASPPTVAKRLNGERIKLTEERDLLHEQAEADWRSKVRWQWAVRATTAISMLAFAFGVSYPLVEIAAGAQFAP